jgi:DnaJ-class molecular chaperone
MKDIEDKIRRNECPECKGLRGQWVKSDLSDENSTEYWKPCHYCLGKGTKKSL